MNEPQATSNPLTQGFCEADFLSPNTKEIRQQFLLANTCVKCE